MDTRRLILVLIFSFSVIMLWEAWQKHNAPKVPVQAQGNSQGTAQGVPQPTTALTPQPGATVPGTGAPGRQRPCVRRPRP